MDAYPYETCDLKPYLDEIVYRMHECRAQNQHTLNLSFSHPRGFIPTKILRRPATRQLLNGWPVANDAIPAASYPSSYFVAPGAKDFATDPLQPYLREVAVRQYEAELEAYHKALATGTKQAAVMDLTCHHPRGGIPPQILMRIKQRESREWRLSANEEHGRLLGESNKAMANAKNMEDRAEGLASKGGDPSNLLAAAVRVRAEAQEYRRQAAFIAEELAGAV